MNIVKVIVENPDELLHASGFGTSAKVRLESSSDGTTFLEESSQTIVTLTTSYTFYDSDGTSATYYRTRYSNSGGTNFSEYSPIFQIAAPPTEYATVGNVKRRIGIGQTAADTTDDGLLETICVQTNSWLEGKIGFPVGPVASEARLFDGSAVRWRDGVPYLNCYPFGVRTVSAVRTASSTGATLTSQTASDVVARPSVQDRTSNWPAFELWVKDTASWTWTTAGYDVNEVTATWGWQAIPPELSMIAEKLAVASYRGRSHGSGSTFAIGADTDEVASEQLTGGDWRVIGKYEALKARIG